MLERRDVLSGDALPGLVLDLPYAFGPVAPSDPEPAAPPGNDLLWQTYTNAQAFELHSNPGANHVIYLDFDGHTVDGTPWNTAFNGGNPFTQQAWSMDADRTTFSATELTKIIELWRRVAEDFAPFDVNVTTEDPGVEALRRAGVGDTQWGMRTLMGPRPAFMPAAGGIAYLNSFSATIDNPCFVWNGDLSATPETSLPTTVSHEVGHTLGLTHDGVLPDTTFNSYGSPPSLWILSGSSAKAV